MNSDMSHSNISRILDIRKDELAVAITDEYYKKYPELDASYGKSVRHHILQDNKYHLTYLSEAIAAGHSSFFAHYIAWAKVLLNGMNIPSEELARNLKIVEEVLSRELGDLEGSSVLQEYIQEGLNKLPFLPSEVSPFIQESHPHGELAQQYLELLLRGERHLASRLILDILETQQINIKEVYLDIFQYAQYEIGRLWQMNKISVAQEHYCTAATQLIMSQLYTYIFTTERKNKAMVATCVGGDLHELGIRMVADFFEMEGWDTYYLGANTPTSSILRELRERGADLLAISVTMTFHVRAAEALIAAVRSDENCRHVKIMVGGYPFNIEPELWQQIGADGYSRNAQEAIELSDQLTS